MANVGGRQRVAHNAALDRAGGAVRVARGAGGLPSHHAAVARSDPGGAPFRDRGRGRAGYAGPALAQAGRGSDEIATLAQAFEKMTQRIAEQWRELTAQDQQRRELFANISHDLRTPLTSLHGYLETLLLKADTLAPEDRRRYLEIALGPEPQGRAAGAGAVRTGASRVRRGQAREGELRAGRTRAGRFPEIRAGRGGPQPAVGARHRLRPARGHRRPGHDRARADQSARQRDPPHAGRRRNRRSLAAGQ